MSKIVSDIVDARAYERRLPWRLLMYWQKKRGARIMPEENDIDPEELGGDWGRCFLLQSRDIFNVVDYNFTYLGAKILQDYENTMLDAHNEFVVGPNASQLSRYFRRMLDSRVPMLDSGELATSQGQRVIFRQILLPLGGASEEVSAIFGGMSFKLVA